MDLNDVAIFARVVRAKSFTAAANQLGMPKSTVSRKVSELEQHLGTQLLRRTTRAIHLTDAGIMFFQYAERIVADLDEASRAVSRLHQSPRGLLRVTVPLGLDFLGPIVHAFLAKHDEVQVEIVCSDRLVDMVNEGFDVAIRAGRLADSSLVGRPLCSMQNLVVASPSYLETRPAPSTPEDLLHHRCLVFGAGSDRGTWALRDGDREFTTNVNSRLVVNDYHMLREAAVAGQGIALLPIDKCSEPLLKKELVRILPSWASRLIPLSVVYPATRLLSPKVKLFVDHIRTSLTPPPWELGPKF
jgi:DNA-binding transcriptional LysR family regulator